MSVSNYSVNFLPVVSVSPHPNADRLDCAVVEGFEVIVGRGTLTPGDAVLYIPRDTVIPQPLADFLGVKSARVRVIRLRGEPSEGLVMTQAQAARYMLDQGIAALPAPGATLNDPPFDLSGDTDYAPLLGITKYIHPALRDYGQSSPKAKAARVPLGERTDRLIPPPERLVSGYDIPNARRLARAVKGQLAAGVRYVVTEKVHGTWAQFGLFGDDAPVISSKGVAEMGAAITEDVTTAHGANVYWRAWRENEAALRKVARFIMDVCTRDSTRESTQPVGVILLGEVYGPQVQDLGYGLPSGQQGLVIFDALVVDKGGSRTWVKRMDLYRVLPQNIRPVCTLSPLVGKPDRVWDRLLEAAEEDSHFAREPGHICEGFVLSRGDGEDIQPGVRQVKLISRRYLERANASEGQ
jgi:RNA ligase (TIGR02306 family)